MRLFEYERYPLPREGDDVVGETHGAWNAAIIAEENKREEARRNREERIRAFAVKEAPELWKTLQDLRGALAEQDARIADLSRTLKDFDKEPSQDKDYMSICSRNNEINSRVLKDGHDAKEE